MALFMRVYRVRNGLNQKQQMKLSKIKAAGNAFHVLFSAFCKHYQVHLWRFISTGIFCLASA